MAFSISLVRPAPSDTLMITLRTKCYATKREIALQGDAQGPTRELLHLHQRSASDKGLPMRPFPPGTFLPPQQVVLPPPRLRDIGSNQDALPPMRALSTTRTTSNRIRRSKGMSSEGKRVRNRWSSIQGNNRTSLKSMTDRTR